MPPSKFKQKCKKRKEKEVRSCGRRQTSREGCRIYQPSLNMFIILNQRGGEVAQLEERRTGKVRFPDAAMDFSPGVNFQCRLTVSVHPYCAITCINISAHDKDRVVHLRVRWIMKTLNRVYSPSRQLRSSYDSRTLRIPHIKTKTFRHRSFSHAALSVRNSLPYDIRHIQSVTAFKTAMKTHLFKSYFC